MIKIFWSGPAKHYHQFGPSQDCRDHTDKSLKAAQGDYKLFSTQRILWKCYFHMVPAGKLRNIDTIG